MAPAPLGGRGGSSCWPPGGGGERIGAVGVLGQDGDIVVAMMWIWDIAFVQ